MKYFEKIIFPIILVFLAQGTSAVEKWISYVPDYRITAEIKAPLAKASLSLVNEKTGEEINIPELQDLGPNPIEVHLKNTGKKPIENLEFIIEFISKGNLNLSDEIYSVKPKRGFGSISFSKPKNTERRVIFGLFNPGDEWIYFATGWCPVTVTTYTKFPGLSFYQEYSPTGQNYKIWRLFNIVFIAFSAVFSLILVCFVQKRIIEQYGIRKILSRGIINAYWNDRTGKERFHFWAGIWLLLISCLMLTSLIKNI